MPIAHDPQFYFSYEFETPGMFWVETVFELTNFIL